MKNTFDEEFREKEIRNTHRFISLIEIIKDYGMSIEMPEFTAAGYTHKGTKEPNLNGEWKIAVCWKDKKFSQSFQSSIAIEKACEIVDHLLAEAIKYRIKEEKSN